MIGFLGQGYGFQGTTDIVESRDVGSGWVSKSEQRIELF